MLAICNAVALLVILLVTAIWLPTFSMDFYSAAYAKYDIARRIGISERQLMDVTKRLTDYMRGRADDIVITVEVNGVERAFFDARDTAHMVDVKALFDIARVSFVAAVCVYAVTWYLLRNDRRMMHKAGLHLSAGLIAIGAVLAGVIALDFDRAFTRFHLLFFDNDLWILDPAVSLLVNMVPQPFFVDIAIRVGLIFGALVLGYIGMSAMSLRKV